MAVDAYAMKKSTIAPELRDAFEMDRPRKSRAKNVAMPARQPVIIELNATFPGGEQPARTVLIRALGLEKAVDDLRAHGMIAVTWTAAGASFQNALSIDPANMRLMNSLQTDRFLFADLTADEVLAIASLTASVPILDPHTGVEKQWKGLLVYKLWFNNPLQKMIYISSRTIKSDAAQVAFRSAGRDIVWAVADTGVATHPHFENNANLKLPDGLQHRDFTAPDGQSALQNQQAALRDDDGHGTHVAGIIAGETTTSIGGPSIEILDGDKDIKQISGVAPHCKIMSLKVIEKDGKNNTDALLAAIGYIQSLNGYGREIRVHGLNISLGYDFNPRNFAAGQSPLCAEVNRLVKCGVVVVVAAGNGGTGFLSADGGANQRAGFMSTITDPGNAEMAITVGSTHRDRPITYGVSFFSAKGPTIDGRMKPDLVAPGEHIVSCDARTPSPGKIAFRKETGTSMAAPHVSGAIAAFLSVRGEFRGQPERVKRLFVDNATNLGRRPEFQGAGLIDLMRTLQAI